MSPITKLSSLLVGSGLLAWFAVSGCASGAPDEPRAATEPVCVELCDGETTVAVEKDGPLTTADGQKIADSLMAQWMRKNPDARWSTAPAANGDEIVDGHRIVLPHDNRDLVASGQSEGNTYGSFTERDVLVWYTENRKMVVEGSAIFHDGDALGSTIAVSCDMCHPDASNTHPETYPKFQVQLGKTVLLRDMINWCLQHPVRAKALDADDPKMRALEAYIYAQRKGQALNYGKH